MRKWIVGAVALGAALGVSGVAFAAAIDNSHHDMQAYLGAATATGKCFYCHGIPESNTTPETLYGNVGNFCVVRCHSSGSLLGAAGQHIPVGPYVYATNVSGQFPTASTYNVARITGQTILDPAQGGHPTGGVAGQGPYVPGAAGVNDQTTGMTGTTWPYTNATFLGTGAIECTSCHAVHDNLKGAPFLWAPMSMQQADAQAPNAAGDFCARCHINRAGVASIDLDVANTYGDHPVEVAWNPTAAAARTAAAGTRRLNRTIALLAPGGNRVFDMPYTSNPAGTFTGARATTANYQTGGHMGAMTAATAPTDGSAGISCSSCHVPHGARIGATNINNLLPAAAFTTNESPLCAGCHREDNPGATNYTHPVNSEMTGKLVTAASPQFTHTSSVGTVTIVTTIPAANGNAEPIAMGTGSELFCLTCHDVHGAASAGMALQTLGQTAEVGSVCYRCHRGAEPATTTANAHHLTGTANYATTSPYAYTNPTWTSGLFGNLTDGLQCPDCHVFNKTAHNW